MADNHLPEAKQITKHALAKNLLSTLLWLILVCLFSLFSQIGLFDKTGLRGILFKAGCLCALFVGVLLTITALFASIKSLAQQGSTLQKVASIAFQSLVTLLCLAASLFLLVGSTTPSETGISIEAGNKESITGTTNIGGVGYEMTWPWVNFSNSYMPEVVSVTATGDNGVGAYFPGRVDSSKLLRISFDIETDHSNFNLYISSSDTLNSGFINVGTITGSGHYDFALDPAYYAVYHDIDIQSVHIVGHFGEETKTFSVSNFRVFQNPVMDAGGKESIQENLIELFQGQSSTIESGLDEARKNIITAPNGLKYILQVDNTGSLFSIPVVPSKVLYIGNSILTGFGHGMAASSPEKDYYHLVNKAIQAIQQDLMASRISGSTWESLESISEKNDWNNNVLAPALSEDLDLIVIQLGDNVNTPERKNILLESSIDLLRFIRSKCPAARVVWVGSWYNAPNLPLIQNACNETGCLFINFNDLNIPENKSSVGSSWLDASGTLQTITSDGVASHPGDEGMKAIANRILYTLGITDTKNYYE